MRAIKGLVTASALFACSVLLCSAAPKAPTGGVLIKSAGACMKSGERTSGFNKVCYYDCLGSEVARTIGSTQLCPLTINGGGPEPSQTGPKPATVCFKQGEETTGQTKQCAYDCLGSLRVVTIKSVQLCPMNIRQ